MAENEDLEQNQNVTENVNVPEAEKQPQNVNVAENVAETDNLAVVSYVTQNDEHIQQTENDTCRLYFKRSTYITYCSAKFGSQVPVRMRCGSLWVPEPLRPTRRYNLYDFVWGVQFWAMEAIPSMRRKLGNRFANHGCPHFKNWEFIKRGSTMSQSWLKKEADGTLTGLAEL
ncbi:hypothetical protein Q3G72_027500 [Acer saccharum]|nr:hypothetical protein Q3G72_027500 [Acer saccharum]